MYQTYYHFIGIFEQSAFRRDELNKLFFNLQIFWQNTVVGGRSKMQTLVAEKKSGGNAGN